MTSDKISISLPTELSGAIRESARESGVGVSAWLAEAAAARLRAEALKALVEEWRREEGPLTTEELNRARRELGLPERIPAPSS